MKLNSNKTKEFFKKLPRALAENLFLASILSIFLTLIIGGFMFYQYNTLIKEAESQIPETLLQFKEKNYQDILTQWQEREKRFNEVDLKQYPNPFQSTATTTID